jgi:hypothetical protein
VQLDLGWARYETRILLRKMHFVGRTMQPDKANSLTQQVMIQAFSQNTAWANEISTKLKQLTGEEYPELANSNLMRLTRTRILQ